MKQEPTQVIVGGVVQSAPRVTIEQIEAEIESETYSKPFDANGVGAAAPDTPENRLNETLTCAIVLKNGWGVYGNGRAAVIEQLYKLFSFELAQKLYREKQTGTVSSLGSNEGKFQKKSGEVVSAVMFTGLLPSINEVNAFMGYIAPDTKSGFMRITAGYIALAELPDKTLAYPGDWVIKGVRGEFYACKKDIFEETYEPIRGEVE